MRRIAATYVFPIASQPIKYGIVELDESGTIRSIIDPKGNLKETENLEYYNGILVPGFVNAHCHIELSYLKGILNGGEGLVSFIKQILSKRTSLPSNLEQIIENADAEMWAEGIVAVGDITNDDFSIKAKRKSKIWYHSMVEVFDRDPSKALEVFNAGLNLFEQYKSAGLDCSMVAHAPYTMSDELLQLLQNHNSIIYSIHNQETLSENELFETKSGAIYELLKGFGPAMADFKPTGQSSLRSIYKFLPKQGNILLVHNIFTKQVDIDAIRNILPRTYWVLCPNSNIIIENQLPDIELFMKNDLTLAIGTDSYSSNSQLSIISELQVIQKHYPQISLNTLLKWATLHGAKALNISEKFGSFEIGKRPGVNLITGIDFEKMAFTPTPQVKSLV